jgi:hypothetical protein
MIIDEDDDDLESDPMHEPWCDGDLCEGTVEVDGGFASAPCLCWCHEEHIVLKGYCAL